MKLLNDTKNDCSNEVMIQLAISLEAVWAAEIICYRLSATLDALGARGTFFQEKKQALNKARRMIQQTITYLETAFDKTFDDIFTRREGEEAMRTEHIQMLANDLVQLLLIYYARGDGDMDRKDSMKRALLNFKPVKDIDLDSIMKYYNFK